MDTFASDTDRIAAELIKGGMDQETAMRAALRLSQSRQQANGSILGGIPTQPAMSDIPPVEEPILGGDPSRLFRREPTVKDRIKSLPQDVIGAGEALMSLGSAAALTPASMLYALRPGQKAQGAPLEFATRNMYLPRTESGIRHLEGLGEVLEQLPQTGPLPELQAFTGMTRGMGTQAAQKAREARSAIAPAVAQGAENLLESQGLLMRAAPSSPKMQAPASDLGFYDPVYQTALNIQRKEGPGQAFLNELQRGENVNKEFLEQSGIAEKLRTTPKITREEVQELAKGAVPEIREIVKGAKGYNEAKVIAAQDIAETIQAGLGHFDDDYQALLNRWRSSPRGSAEERQAASTLEALLRQAGDVRGVDEYIDAGGAQTVNTKYAQYQLPGGENYREVLLTMPSRRPSIKNMTRAEYNAAIEKADKEGIADYQSSHWDEPNVVAHIRMNDRTDSDGKKVLFVEELQSDWGQQGRKKGFRDDEQQEKQFQKLAERHIAAVQRRSEIVGNPQFFKEYEDLQREEIKLINEMNKLHDIKQYGVPQAPFVTNTKEWVDLSLKNIIKRAVDEGYDRVAFINGQQSADRYDLSKQIGELYHWRDGNKYGVSAYDLNDRAVIDQETYTADQLENYVGKEIAQKIINREGTQAFGQEQGVLLLQGDGLKVGGEGMKAFYDKLVPERVNAILKRFGGGKLGEVGVRIEAGSGNDPLHDYHFDGRINQFVVDRVDNNGVSQIGRFPDRDSAAAAVDRLNRESATPRMQPGFEITPAMRERFQKPIPYKEGGSVDRKKIEDAAKEIAKKYAKGGSVLARQAASAARAKSKSKQDIENIARRIAEQTQPGFVRKAPDVSINPEEKSRALYELEQRTPMVVESTIEDKPIAPVDYEKQLGAVIIGVPGDPTMGQVAVPGSLEVATKGGKQLKQVGDVIPEHPVYLYGGPRYGTTQDDVYWASNISAARNIQNLVDEMAEKHGTEKVLGQYMKMSPESSKFAMHNLDALISVLQPEKLSKDKINLLNKLVQEGTAKEKFPQFVGFEDPAELLLQAQFDSNLRKQISSVLEKPKVAESVGFPFPGRVVQTAITEPELRNLETGVTGFAVGQMKPKGALTLSRHPTYEYDIPGQLLGKSKYPIPYELAFPDFMEWFRAHPELPSKVDPFNMLKSVGARQKVDPQYIDEIKMYEEAMKKMTGKKKGGLAAIKRK